MARSTKAAREARIEEVGRLHLRGWTQTQIALELGVCQQTVSDDVLILKTRWREASLTTAREEIARLEAIYEEAMRAWSVSKKSACLQAALGARDRIAKLAGLDTPQRIELSGPAGSAVRITHDYSALSDEDLDTLAGLVANITQA